MQVIPPPGPPRRPASRSRLDGERWALVNASPDLRQQIEANPVLHPRQGLRSSPIAAVLLTNGDVDAVMGLLHLREGTPFALYAHERIHAVLGLNPLFKVLDRDLVPRRRLVPDEWHDLADREGSPLGLRIRPFVAPGKVALYLEGKAERLDTAAETGDALGIEVMAGAARLIYLANCAAMPMELLGRICGSTILFMDGTLWRDDEMILQGVGTKTGRRMGHVSMSGPDGAIARLTPLSIGRRIFIHVNNTNPALLADSPERAQLERAGWEVAYDGMELSL